MNNISMTTGDLRWSTRARRPVRRFAEEQEQQPYDTNQNEEQERDNLNSSAAMTPPAQRSISSGSEASTNGLFADLKVANRERVKWLVDDLDEAPDNQNLKPKLRRPHFQKGRDVGLLARFIDGGPCYICKATKSCDIWHSNLYMKRPVPKASVVTANGFNRLEKECYEWYCSECFQLDYLRRKVIGGACDVCGKHETIDRFETHMFNSHDDQPRRICSGCYEKDYNRRAGLLNAKHKKMHDEWKGQKVSYDADMRASSIGGDVVADETGSPLRDRHRGKGKKPDRRERGRERWLPKPRQPVVESEGDASTVSESTQTVTEDDADATINDETLIDPEVSRGSLGSRRRSGGVREDTAYSSGPDDESRSPRLARRHSSARPAPILAPPRTWAQPSGRFSFEAALAVANDPDLTLEDYLGRESSVVSSGQPGDRGPPVMMQKIVLPVREGAQTAVQARLEAARRPAPATMVGGRRRGSSRRPRARKE